MDYLEKYGYLDFKVIREDWSEYLLEDGTLVKLRPLLIKALRGQKDLELNVETLVATYSPKELRGEPSSEDVELPDEEDIMKIPPLKFDVVKQDAWNEYELNDKTKLRLKINLSSAIRLNIFNPAGEPVYQLEYEGQSSDKESLS